MEQLKIKFFAKQVRDISLIYENLKIPDLYWCCLPFTMTIRVILLWIIRQPCNIPCFLVHINVIIQVTLAIIWKKAVLYQTTETILLLRCQKQQMFFYGRDLQMTHCLEMLGNCGSLIYLFLLNSLHKVLLVMFPKWTNYNVETKIYTLHLNLFFFKFKISITKWMFE